jgi:hypothetical protein
VAGPALSSNALLDTPHFNSIIINVKPTTATLLFPRHVHVSRGETFLPREAVYVIMMPRRDPTVVVALS